MIVAFGTSTPTSITVVATRTSSSPRLEARHQLAPLGRPQPAVQEPDAVARAARRAAAARPRARPRARRSSRTPRSTGRRRRPAGRRRGARAGAVYASRARSSVDPGGHDRLAVRRRLGDLADGEVAVDGERERARDRRRGHVQHVRRCGRRRSRARCSTPKRCCSSTTATARSRQVDVLLDQRVRADERCCASSARAPLARGRRELVEQHAPRPRARGRAARS